jgi:hypothetical protein
VDAVEKGRMRSLFGEHQTAATYGRTKLTEEQVKLIRSTKDSGASLAKKFGVCHQTISWIRTGQTWKQIQLSKKYRSAAKGLPTTSNDHQSQYLR